MEIAWREVLWQKAQSNKTVPKECGEVQPKMVRIMLLAITLAASACQLAGAQKATVTFYSPTDPPAHQLLETVEVFGVIPFFGNVFDGDQKLANIHRGRFVTFELPHGTHVFSGNLKNKPSDKYTLILDASENEHYFVRIVSKWKSLGIVLLIDPQLESVNCTTAAKEIGRSRPIETKHISKDAQQFLAPDASISCP